MLKREVYAGAALLGAMAGMRSMAAPIAVGQLARSGALAGASGPLALLTRPAFGTAANLLGAVELVADKLPFTPNRTAAGPLLGRALTGGMAGAVLCAARKRPPFAGFVVGGLAAIGAAYAAYELRKRAVTRLQAPDFLIALAEDALVGAAGLALTARLRR